ncbi:hypothetical protein RFI_28303, partial [Reticulomyxa filosa]
RIKSTKEDGTTTGNDNNENNNNNNNNINNNNNNNNDNYDDNDDDDMENEVELAKQTTQSIRGSRLDTSRAIPRFHQATKDQNDILFLAVKLVTLLIVSVISGLISLFFIVALNEAGTPQIVDIVNIVCVCVCMYVCIRIFVHIIIYCVYIYIYIYIYVYVYYFYLLVNMSCLWFSFSFGNDSYRKITCNDKILGWCFPLIKTAALTWTCCPKKYRRAYSVNLQLKSSTVNSNSALKNDNNNNNNNHNRNDKQTKTWCFCGCGCDCICCGSQDVRDEQWVIYAVAKEEYALLCKQYPAKKQINDVI